ncbi:MAG: phosphoenolpyruvate carboxylase, partial [Cyanobacteriota bacterium]
MSSVVQSSIAHPEETNVINSSHLLLRHRQKLVEDLWESVLRSECGQEMLDLLQQMRSLHSAEGQVAATFTQSSVPQLIQKLSLHDAIQGARAFALYFQLINIVEQHYESREQKLARRVTQVYSPELNGKNFNGKKPQAAHSLTPEAFPQPPSELGDNLTEPNPSGSNQTGLFPWLFPYLKEINMPPLMLQRLLDQLDIRLVFTAHPTEIVRHTIRKKQRRISQNLEQLDIAEEAMEEIGQIESWEANEAIAQLTEEIRLWWRTDELHQFKPKVLDEVDYALHYFQEVLFDVIPQLASRLKQSLKTSFPNLVAPTHNFCYFGSWVGSDRDGNPFVTPQVTWETACYQRKIVIGKYLDAIAQLREILSLSLHWSDVQQELLDSLEQDQQQMPSIYQELSIRYRQEPYRLKLAYISCRLTNTMDRNQALSSAVSRHAISEINTENVYTSGDELVAELKLMQRSLAATSLQCRELDNLITQAEVFGFNLVELDFRQDSSRHSDAIAEITAYLQVLPKPYNELSESEKTAWLIQELKTRRPLIPGEMPFSPTTCETIETFR